MIASFSPLTISGGTLVACLLASVLLLVWCRETIVEFLRSNPSVRRTIYFVVAYILPLPLGWAFDVCDISQAISKNEATVTQNLWLSAIIVTGAVYLTTLFVIDLTTVKLQSEEANIKAQLKSSDTLRDSYASILDHLRVYIDANRAVLDNWKSRMQQNLPYLHELMQYPGDLFSANIRNLCRSVKNAMELAGNRDQSSRHSTLEVALFERRGDKLQHVYSLNAVGENAVESMCAKYPHYFDFTLTDKPNDSPAKRALLESRVIVTEDCEKAVSSDNDPFNSFGGAGTLGDYHSMLTLPIQGTGGVDCVLWLASTRRGFFSNNAVNIRSYSELRDEVTSRVRLLHSQREFLTEYWKSKPPSTT